MMIETASGAHLKMTMMIGQIFDTESMLVTKCGGIMKIPDDNFCPFVGI